MSYRTIFHNSDFEKQFNEFGYITQQVLNADDIQRLLQIFKSLNPEIGNQFYSTIDSKNLEYRKKVDKLVGEVLADKVTGYFIDYSPLIFNFIVKDPGGNSEVQLHTDDTHVDESKFQSVNIWCPLVDTTKENGALYVLPGSHRLYYPPRGFGLPYPYNEFHSVVKPRMQLVPLKAGEAVFYNNKLMHCSEPNTTNTSRPAVITAMLPNEAAKIIHFRTDALPEHKVEVFELSKEFYLNFDRTKRPEKFKSLGVVNYQATKPTPKIFLKMLDNLNEYPRKSLWSKIKHVLQHD